jgi:NADP-dependent alcohol dehydrogenase
LERTNRKIIKTCFTNASKILLAYGGGSIFKNGVHEAVTLALKGAVSNLAEPNPRFETLMKAVEIIKQET